MSELEDLALPDLGSRDDGPLVSVIVPTYEDADRLGPALESIAAQSYDSVEIVIVDSSGVDALERLASDTQGVVYVYQEPAGLAAARNYGIDVASGALIAFLDADDRWYANKLSAQIREIEAGADVVYSDVHVRTDEGAKRRLTSLPIENPERHHLDLLFEGGVPILTVLARRECFADIRFDEELPAVEDRNLLARLFAEYTPGRVPEPLAEYRQREGSMSSDAETMYSAELASLDALSEDLPLVAAHYEELVALADYKYGKRLLRSGRPAAARSRLLRAARNGHLDARLLLLLGVSLLPVDHERALWQLERLQERLS